MDSSALVETLQHAVPAAQIEQASTVDLHATISVNADAVPAMAQALRDRPELGFGLLIELTAVDFWPREPRFELVYLLVSTVNRTRLRMKVRLPAGAARVATVSHVWPAANWLEREVWDLFGIEFERHPDPRRLLMPEDWEGYPLRKDYPVQVKLPARVSEPLQVSEAEFRANLTRDRLVRGR